MKIVAFNGGPRKTWNTAMLLERALEGAAAQGAETRMVHLYDLNYQGCHSCFGCKKRGSKHYGQCAVRDGLTPILNELSDLDAFVIGSPIYLGDVTGETRSFLERLIFPLYTYTNPPQSLFGKKIRTAMIYTMNVDEKLAEELNYRRRLALGEGFLQQVFGSTESLFSFNTLQFDDYSKVVADRFDEAAKRRRRAEVFPQDCRKAFELGARLAGAA